MRIPSVNLAYMYATAGVDMDKLYYALQVMGSKHLKGKELKENWSHGNPTYGYCYVVSEWLYWYHAPEGTIPYSMKVPGDPGTHRFLEYPETTSCYGSYSNAIIDLTAIQFSNYEDVDYSTAKRTPFMQTGCIGPSKRAKMLAELMGDKPEQWRNPNNQKQQTSESLTSV